MGSLTRRQCLRLAREARKLAMECVEGTAPELNPMSFCGCAIGEILAREGARPTACDARWTLAVQIDKLVAGLVSDALMAERCIGSTAPWQSALVFPLLTLADALEEVQP